MAGACLGVVVLLGDGAEPRHVSELTLVSGVCVFIVRLTTAPALTGSHFSGHIEATERELASAPKSNKHPQLIRIDMIPLVGANPAFFTNDVEQFTNPSGTFSVPLGTWGQNQKPQKDALRYLLIFGEEAM